MLPRKKTRYWLGKKRPDISAKLKGRTYTAETLQKMSIARIGKTPWNKGKKMSPEFCAGVSKRQAGQRKPERSGEKCNFWKGGVTPLKKAVRALVEMRIWRTHVFQRDDYRCTDCKERGGSLNADHIIPLSAVLQIYNIKTIAEAQKCEFLWDIRNGRTLCVPCHKKTPTFGSRGKVQSI